MNTLDPTTLAIKQGLEPVTLVGIDWASNGGVVLYGDVTAPFVEGKILNLPELTNEVNADGAGESQSITIKFDDSDGTILNVLNSIDCYLVKVYVYQWFKGYPIDIKSVVYEGAIVGPITWSEGDRTVEIQCTTRRANVQVGFSYDETNTNILHQSLIGKVWPLPFGTPVNYPALQLQEIPSGITTKAFGLPDPSIFWQIAKLQLQIQAAQAPYQALITSLRSAQSSSGSKVQGQYNSVEIPALTKEMNTATSDLENQVDALIFSYAEQAQFALTDNIILGGYKFPQGVPVKCKINDQIFTCTFLGGNNTTLTNPNEACPVHIVPFYMPGFPMQKENTTGSTDSNNPANPNYSYQFPSTISQYGGQGITINVPQINSVVGNPGGLTIPDPGSETIFGSAIPDWSLTHPVVKSGFSWFSPGSSLTLIDDFQFSFLVSYLPGTVINVYAYRSNNGLRTLTQVPPRYYNIVTQGNFTYVAMGRPLSIISYLIEQRTTEAEAYLNQTASDFNGFVAAHVVNSIDWEDQVYVTFQSSVGPNVADILAWLITNYTPYQIDNYSFNAVGAALDNYPANFVVLDRPLVDDLMNDICYQSRCSLVLRDDTYYLTYLPGQPGAVAVLTFDDIEQDTLKISTTPVESLITRYTATWKPDYSPDYAEPNKIIVKNNQLKYGYIDGGHDYFIYNQMYLVRKSAIFWLLRTSQVFKTVSFNVMLNNLNLQVQDSIILNFSENLFCDGPCTVTITGQTYDSENHTISLTCWTPIKLGQFNPYLFAWPANLSITDYWYPINTTTSGGSLGYDPGEIPDPPPYNNIPTQNIDYSDWPDQPGDILGYNQSLANWSKTAPGPSEDSEDQKKADDESSTNPTNPGEQTVPPTPMPVADANDPTNNANQRNTQIPTPVAESPIPTNPKLSPDYSVPLVTTPTPPNNPDTGASCYPAQIVSGSGNIFQCNVYVDGLDNEYQYETCNEVHNDMNLYMDPGTWVTVMLIQDVYYIVMPSWSH